MRSVRSDEKPRWWLLYTIGLLLVGLIALVEIFVPASGQRGALEITVVIEMFGLMAQWLRRNRVGAGAPAKEMKR